MGSCGLRWSPVTRTIRFPAIPLSLAVLVAGCLGTEEEQGGEDGDDGSVPPLPLPNATLPLIAFNDCTDQLMGFEIPKKTADAVIPDAFKPFGLTGASAAAIVDIFTCGRVANDTTVFGAAHLLWGFVFVETVNESWASSRNADRYLLEVIVDNAALRDALAAWNVTVGLGTFESTKTPAGPENAYVEHWLVQTPLVGIAADLPQEGALPQPVDFLAQLWWGPGPFDRATWGIHKMDYNTASGSFAVAGAGPLASAFGSVANVHVGSLYNPVNFSIQHDGSWSEA